MPTPFLAFRQTSFSKRLQRYYILFIICKHFENFICFFVNELQNCHISRHPRQEELLFLKEKHNNCTYYNLVEYTCHYSNYKQCTTPKRLCSSLQF